MRIEIVGYREPGTDRAQATLFSDGEVATTLTIDLSTYDGSPDDYAALYPGAEVTIVDPGRGWEGQLDEWRANRDQWASSASPAAAELIRAYHDQGETTPYVTSVA